jgi:serine-type D-Ala-D-Ala carboxypeptidase/endopeptidase (penicillin-binding protein 4)
VQGPDVATPPDAGRDSAGAPSRVVARLEGPTVAEVVGRALTDSDNLAGEVLFREVGRARDGAAEAVDAVLAELGVDPGSTRDGSGLSTGNARSARGWRTLLQAAAEQPWGDALLDALPVAGRTGTLTSRLTGTAAEGNLRAKTGWVHEARSLSGVLTTAGGRRCFLSVVANTPTAADAVNAAIDDLVAVVAADPS